MALRDKEDETADLLFKVNGAHHKGFVLITLAGNELSLPHYPRINTRIKLTVF
jgi:hypothetical protein